MLIEFEDIAEEEIKDPAVIQAMEDEEIGFKNLDEKVTPQLQKRCCFQYVSNGHWSMHQLLEKTLQMTGPADIYLSSFAFSELPARKLADLKGSGIIKSLYCIIDNRIDVRSAGALQLIKNTADKLKMCHTHAKVTVIKNENFHFVIVGSANYTTNKRYESGVIVENKNLAEANVNWILNELVRR